MSVGATGNAYVDIAQLRTVIQPVILSLKDRYTHATLGELCEGLGMPPRGAEGSKADRLYASFEMLPDEGVPQTANRLIERGIPGLATRNIIQDLLWEDDPYPVIPLRFRRELAQALDKVPLFGNLHRFDELLHRLWIIESNPFAAFLGKPDEGLAGQIERHVYRNPDDWTTDELFERLGAYDASDQRFGRFVEGLASAEVRPDVDAQRAFVGCANRILVQCAAELRETGIREGYPEFSLVHLYDRPGSRPKNIIFASARKPDLRFRDAINNDIEIVTHADEVLVYDRPIGNEGLKWRDLQAWWSEQQGIDNDSEAKAGLYKRLKGILPKESPPQAVLFTSFFKTFGQAIPGLPALLPEVWLHWDPHTVRERGADALLRFRMDFLLLLPHGVRIVVEIDGAHHYSDPKTRLADPERYALMAAGDRDLKLAGYEVYRFGAAELLDAGAQARVGAFFRALFQHYRLTGHA